MAFGIAMLLAAFIMDITGANSSLVELAGLITLIVSSNTTLRKRNAAQADYLLAAGSGAFSIMLSFLFHNGSFLMLGGVIIIIVSVIRFLKRR